MKSSSEITEYRSYKIRKNGSLYFCDHIGIRAGTKEDIMVFIDLLSHTKHIIEDKHNDIT